VTKEIVVISTMDTKGYESEYLVKKICDFGAPFGIRTINVDVGIRGEALGIQPDITRYEVAKAGGYDMTEVRKAVRGDAIAMMADGAKKVIKELYNNGQCDGIVSLCGGSGGSITKEAMEMLPVGIPKMMATPLASGPRPFEFYVKNRDIMIMHSVIDIIGINSISMMIYDNLAAAIVGAVAWRKTYEKGNKKTIGVTMIGNTTDGVTVLKKELEKCDYEVVCFHSSGVGGRAMEEMIKDGYFDGIVDYTTCEIFEDIIGGLQRGAGPDRMTVAGSYGIPQVVVPGCVDFFDQGPIDTVPEHIAKKRKLFKHSPAFTLCKLTKEEMAYMGKVFAEKLNPAKGKVIIAVPLKGFSIPGCPGGPFEDNEATEMFVKNLKKHIIPEIPVVEIDAHVNDSIFAKEVAKLFMQIAN
jgi:uncharacterized protein (UPF0261 family)